MELIEPSAEYKNSFIEAVKEFVPAGTTKPRDPDAFYERFSVEELENNFDVLLEYARDRREGKNLPEGWVPSTDYWLVDDGEFIGRVNIRHEITEHLRQIGGQIGYDIRPSKRRRGYGKQILKLALQKAKEMGIKKVIITCDVSNEPSRKIIEANGGVFENEVPKPETNLPKRRYSIEIK